MAYDGKFCCPDCGSENAVSKAVAWDAKASIPPKVTEELRRLHNIEISARALLSSSPHAGDGNTVVITVPVRMLERLAEATGVGVGGL